MKSIKHIALSIILTLGVFGAVLYTSCQKSGCKGVTCLNGSACSGGICGPCLPGIGGTNCETIYRKLYSGNIYTGVATYYNSKVVDSNRIVDSTYVIRVDTSNTLSFVAQNDSVYTQMQLAWNRPGRSGGSTTITLSNNTTTGSNFSVNAFQIDTFTCTGTGSINGNTASLNLVAKPPHSPAITITLSDFSR